MLKIVAAALAIASFVAVNPARACEGHEGMTAEIKTITVDVLAQKLDAAKAKKDAATFVVFDASSDKTRAEKGVIPTAKLLPSVSDYDTALLPQHKDTEVIFYCAATKCTSSKTAAKRAVEAGHTNVSVFPEGIAGWISAGKPAQKVAAQKAPQPLMEKQPASAPSAPRG